VVESYRRIRNTLRFLLANTADFDPARHALPVADWVEIDRYALGLTARMQREATQDYERYEFHPIVAKLQTFCSEDLGAFYLDVLKDRLYTCKSDSHARRSAQNALYHLTQALVRLMAPVLSFTAEEAWKVAGDGSPSVLLQTWYELPLIPDADSLLERWSLIRAVRAQVQRELEALRSGGSIGSSLQARVEVHACGEKHRALATLGEDLKFVFITSDAALHPAVDAAAEKILAAPITHAKCERCWHWRSDVGRDPAHPGLCGRCLVNLFGAGEVRRYA
jgi:isoleucyl-tRNA synthetase